MGTKHIEADSILSTLDENLKIILSSLESSYDGLGRVSVGDWKLINTKAHRIIQSLKTFRDKGGSIFKEGHLLKWSWTEDSSSTRVAKLNGWQITHDAWLYNVFYLVPPVENIPFEVQVNGQSYSIEFSRGGYNINIPSSILLKFERVHGFGKLTSVTLEWLFSGNRWNGEPHRENNLPALIIMAKGKTTLRYYLYGLEHGGNKYYGFESRIKDGLTEIRCPECGGEGRQTYIHKQTKYSPGGLGWTPMHYVEEIPYKDKCHMCTMPLEKIGRGWITLLPENEKEIQKLALGQRGKGGGCIQL